MAYPKKRRTKNEKITRKQQKNPQRNCSKQKLVKWISTKKRNAFQDNRDHTKRKAHTTTEP